VFTPKRGSQGNQRFCKEQHQRAAAYKRERARLAAQRASSSDQVPLF
jgi:hypothetical protein